MNDYDEVRLAMGAAGYVNDKVSRSVEKLIDAGCDPYSLIDAINSSDPCSELKAIENAYFFN